MVRNLQLQKPRAAVYLRVSTDEQARAGFGLQYQEEKLRAFIVSQEYSLDERHVYKDEGYSGTFSSEQRPALKKLLEDGSKKEFDVVLVYRLDRLFRKTVLLIQTVDKLNTFGVGFRSITEAFDTTNITGKFLMTLLGAMAEMERDTIRERTVNGRTSAAKSGKWVVGLPPYGYRVNKETKKLYIVKGEVEVIRKFFEWIVYERMSLKKVATRINSMSIDSPKHTFINRRKTFNHWYERTIGRILTNEIYTGTAYFRKYKRPFNNLTSLTTDELKRPKDDWIAITVPPIISVELFEKAKEQLLRNREDSARNTKRLYLYSKVLYCGDCRHKMFSGYQKAGKNSTNKEGTRYYRGVYRKPDAVGTTKRCLSCDQYAESRLEPIWNCLKEILHNPKNLKTPLEKYKFNGETKAEIIKRILECEQRIASVEVKERKLVSLFLDKEQMDQKQYDDLASQFRKEKEGLKTDVLRLNQSIIKKEDERDREKVMQGLYAEIKSRLSNITYEEKRKIIHLFIDRINLHQKKNYAEVIFKFPVREVAGAAYVQTVPNNINLIMDVKTMSEKEIRQKILIANPLMYKGIKEHENLR